MIDGLLDALDQTGQTANTLVIWCAYHGDAIAGRGEEILQRGVITERYKYVAALYDGDELYDLAEDPQEMHNLIDTSAHREIKQELRRRIIEHVEHTQDPRAGRLAYALEQGS